MASSVARDLSSVRETIYQAISSIRLIDPHTHINPHNPGSNTLADILGYHYYTELVHSAGMPRSEIEEPGISPRELVGRMVHGLGNITNTANYHWLIQICQEFFDFQDDAITVDNWENLFDNAEAKMSSAQWPQMVLDQSNVEAVFLTNDFDDALEGFDSSTYIPCLRTDDLVFHLAKSEVRSRLEACSGIALDGSLSALRASLQQRFEHFVSRGARACAISIPPSFQPAMVSDGRAQVALENVLQQGTEADSAHLDALSRRVFWTLAELCDQFELPFDLMIGVNRGVYPSGVYQGQDLYDSRVSLIQYKELFNAFPNVKFPVSVLASVTNQELVSYSWIFPNVLTNGHWWYSNTPSFIHRDAAARLEAVPRNKQIAYYSDAYKLEFVLPKFDMYRRVLSRVLAEEFVGENRWSEEKAIQLGRQVLRGNVDEVFRSPLIARDDAVGDQGGAASLLGAGAAALAMGTDAGADDDHDDVASTSRVEPQRSGLENAAPEDNDDDLLVSDAEAVAASNDEELVSELSAFLESDTESEIFDPMGTLPDDNDKTVGPGLGTVSELDETIMEPPVAPSQMETAEMGEDESDDDSVDEQVDLDPVPTSQEIESSDIADVLLSDVLQSDFPAHQEASSLDDEIDPLPLDVGDLFGDSSLATDDTATDVDKSPIQMLTGETQFTPDSDSLVLKEDPRTGELQFPMPASAQADEAPIADPEQSIEPEIESSPVEPDSTEPKPDPPAFEDDGSGFGSGIF